MLKKSKKIKEKFKESLKKNTEVKKTRCKVKSVKKGEENHVNGRSDIMFLKKKSNIKFSLCYHNPI